MPNLNPKNMKKTTGCLLLIICWSTLCFAQQVVVTDATLSGNGTTATPLIIARQLATTGQVLKWNGTSWKPSADGLNLPFNGETSTGTYGISIGHTATSGVTYGGQFISLSSSGRGVYGKASATNGSSYGGYFEGYSDKGIGVLGIVTNSMGTTNGIRGVVNSTSGIGVYGQATANTGANYGGYFESYGNRGTGVFGKVYSFSDTSYGGYFENSSTRGRGVMGFATATSGNNYGGYFVSSSYAGIGVSGIAPQRNGLNFGGTFSGSGDQGRGVLGAAPATSGRNFGGYFYSNSTQGRGVYGMAYNNNGRNYGGYFESTSDDGIGVYGRGSRYAGYFDGRGYFERYVTINSGLTVNGMVIKIGGTFQIDHPLDPANQILRHSFVESPDMMNVYNGNIITDGNGNAVVKLPGYFESLNKDFRYQLTVIGVFAQAIVAEKISKNQFTIRTDKPNVEVSWQVTGIRKDPWAEQNRIIVEENKKPEEQGYYIYPQGYGQPESRSIMSGEKAKMIEEKVGESEGGPVDPIQHQKEMPKLDLEIEK